MENLGDVVTSLVTVAVALPAVYVAVKKRLLAELHRRLDKISGGRVGTLEALVTVALSENRLRCETPIAVYGGEWLWLELRRGDFKAAVPAATQGEGSGAQVAVVDAQTVPEDKIGTLQEPYLLIYKEGKLYGGPRPPGADVTYANSSITLDARLMEALRHRQARS